ncbi:MAG: hypothetical protein NVV73_07115 [Cellvibrionaceae bacterium]|nr:hypothetical protein [Cellvibrionaceae bacterium]
MQTRKPYGLLALQYCHIRLPLKVLRSAAGYYIGTANELGGPCSRESNEYWELESEAERALEAGRWTQKMILV